MFHWIIIRSVGEDDEHVDVELDGTWKVKAAITTEQEALNIERKRKREIRESNVRDNEPAKMSSFDAGVIDLTLSSDEEDAEIRIE